MSAVTEKASSDSAPGGAPTSQGDREARRRQRRLRGFKLVAMLGGFLLACLIAEAGLRLAGYEPSFLNPISGFHVPDPLTGYCGKPDHAARFRSADFDVMIRHNSLGFRQLERQPDAASAPARQLFVLGDSYVWGWGVGQGQTMTDHLADRLQDYRVHNLGLNGSGTITAYTLFEQYARDQLRAGDVVLLMFCFNDFHDCIANRLHARVDSGGHVVPQPVRRWRRFGLFAWLRDRSYLVNLLGYQYDRLKQTLKAREDAATVYQLIAGDQNDDRAVIVTHYLKAFQRACEARGAHFVAAFIPGQAELGEPNLVDEHLLAAEKVYRRAFENCAREAGVATVDLLTPFLDGKASGRLTGPLTFTHDQHWNAQGHRAAADVLAPVIGGLNNEINVPSGS